MTTRLDEDHREIADAVLPAEVDELAVPAELDQLLPWHTPRKQLVRENQWIQFSRRLIQREKDSPAVRAPGTEDREIRYLTLPGIDFLDVRQLADVCRELGCSLTSTGFESGREGNRQVARAQLTEKALVDAGRITKRSLTFPRRFEDIAQTTSNAYRDLRRRAPFHIVNVDACGSIAAPAARHASRLIDAVHKVVELQLELTAGRWLLFVTTHVQTTSIAQTTLERLCDAVFENAEESDEFREGVADLLNAGNSTVKEAMLATSRRDGVSFLQLFSLGLAKWFLHMVRNRGWQMKTHVPYCYSTMPQGDSTPSMVCLAFEFLPPPAYLEDRFGVTLPKPVPNAQREDLSVRAIDRIRDMTNADTRIQMDESLRVRVTQNLCRSLREVGYPGSVLEELCA